MQSKNIDRTGFHESLNESDKKKKSYLVGFAILLASMGYFVDIYDLLLFSIG